MIDDHTYFFKDIPVNQMNYCIKCAMVRYKSIMGHYIYYWNGKYYYNNAPTCHDIRLEALLK